MAITKGEAIQVAGKALIQLGEAFDDPTTPNKIDKAELINIIQTAISNALSEFAD